MDAHILVSGLLFFCIFFATISILQILSKKTSFPYTVSLLIAGFIAQYLVQTFHLEANLNLDANVIYYLLLPLLLFESAMHINIHQFRLQFWTITFISTFGLLISLFIVGFGLAWVIGMPLGPALLFGALISATDPIAVLSLFKSLGAPKRLALIADGESMFNDATAVIGFKVVAGFVLTGAILSGSSIANSLWNLTYVFFGSIILGGILGYISSDIIRRVKSDHVVEATITITLALGSFLLADHLIHLSGVITTVMAGITLGNLGKTRISTGVKRFVNRIWEYVAFLCVSLVFFFASFQLDIGLLVSQLDKLHAVILILLIARAISVYVSFYFSNKLPIFRNEPDVPLSWQHILNWGGLRGVIPLVLAYTIPVDYQYRDEIISFTLAALVFTLLVNALTIRWFLIKLGLHLPKKEEVIINEELSIFQIEEKKKQLKTLSEKEFSKSLIKKANQDLEKEELEHKQKLLALANKQELNNALRLQAIEITRQKLIDLFEKGHISEGVVNEYEGQLDLQQDAIEYPEVYYGRGYLKGGRIPNQKLFRQRLQSLNSIIRNFPILKPFLGIQEKDLITQRIMFLKAKIVCVEEILIYLERVEKISASNKQALAAIKEVTNEYNNRKIGYELDLKEINSTYPLLMQQYQSQLLANII
jgi:monovalent cation:H+ antiporter, CPA1 family